MTGLMQLEQGPAAEAMAWNIPGGEVAGSGIVFHVPVGDEVLIWKRAVARGDTAWFEISRLEMESERGWVRARDVEIDDTQATTLRLSPVARPIAGSRLRTWSR